MTIDTKATAKSAGIRTLNINELRPADILLSKGPGFLSNLIAEADGGQFSHGALWSGTGIIQATGDGITLSEIEGKHAVYRYPDLPDEAAAKIVALAKAQVEGRYAYGELVLLGALFLSGIRVKGAVLTRLLDAIGGPTASKLKAWLDHHAGRGARVCTELVASCYYEAANGKFALQVRSRTGEGGRTNTVVTAATPPGTRGPRSISTGIAPDVDDSQLQSQAIAAAQSCIDLLSQPDLEVRAETRKLLAGAIARDAGTGADIGVVTPADLEFSPSLTFVGRLDV